MFLELRKSQEWVRMSYIEGAGRGQSHLFPPTIDEYIEAENPVRAIAAFLARVDFLRRQ